MNDANAWRREAERFNEEPRYVYFVDGCEIGIGEDGQHYEREEENDGIQEGR